MESMGENMKVKFVYAFCAFAAVALLNPFAVRGVWSQEQADSFSAETQSIESPLAADWSKGAHIKNIITLTTEFIDSVEFSPDSQYLLVSASVGHTGIYNVADGSQIAVSKAVCESASRIWLTPDSRYLIADSYRGPNVWSFPDGNDISTFRSQTGYYKVLGISNGGKYAVVANTDETVSVFEIPSGSIVCKLNVDMQSIHKAAFSSDDQYLAVSEFDSTTQIWRVDKWLMTGKVPSDISPEMSFCPGKPYLLLAGMMATRIWTVPHGAYVTSVQYSGDISAFDPEGNYFYAGYWDRSPDGIENSIGLYRIPDGRLLKSYPGHSDRITALSICTNGWFFAAGSADCMVYIYYAPTCEVVAELKYHNAEIEVVVFSPDGRYLATAGRDGRVIIWEPNA